jgi:transposase
MDDVVRKRLKILNHWHKFGLASAVDAFGVSKSTLYAWRKSLKQAGAILRPSSRRANVPSASERLFGAHKSWLNSNACAKSPPI